MNGKYFVICTLIDDGNWCVVRVYALFVKVFKCKYVRLRQHTPQVTQAVGTGGDVSDKKRSEWECLWHEKCIKYWNKTYAITDSVRPIFHEILLPSNTRFCRILPFPSFEVCRPVHLYNFQPASEKPGTYHPDDETYLSSWAFYAESSSESVSRYVTIFTLLR